MKGFMVFVFLLTLATPLMAQTRTAVFAAVLSNKRYIVGADNPPTGLQVSYDDGTTWTCISWPNIRCFSFDIVPGSDGQTIYIAAGNGVLKTVDGGKKWRQTTDWRVTEVLDVRVDPWNPQTVYLASAYGIWKSTDGGGTWVERNRGLGDTYVSALAINRQDPQRLLAGTETGVWMSENGAERWRPAGLQGVGVRVIRQHPTQGKTFFAGIEDGGVQVSTDGGRRWKPSAQGISDRTVYDIVFDPRRPEVVYAGIFGGGVYKSEDGGVSWVQKSQGLTNLVIHSVAVHPSKALVFAGSINDGIFVSTDGAETWRFTGLEGAQVWRLKAVELGQ